MKDKGTIKCLLPPLLKFYFSFSGNFVQPNYRKKYFLQVLEHYILFLNIQVLFISSHLITQLHFFFKLLWKISNMKNKKDKKWRGKYFSLWFNYEVENINEGLDKGQYRNICLSLCVCMCTYIYRHIRVCIRIYTERERDTFLYLPYIPIYMYTQI